MMKPWQSPAVQMNSPANTRPKVIKTEAEWKQELTPEQYHVTRQHGTERAFSGPYWNQKASGMYGCVCCGAPLFSSNTKFDSGTGWPSFWAPVDKTAVSEFDDRSWLMNAPKSAAPPATRTSATSSPMGRSRPARAIA